MMDNNDYDAEMFSALTDIVRQESHPDAVAARNLLLRRIASEGSVVPSRIPAPLNITQIGGYLNLLESLEQDDLRVRLLASALGVSPTEAAQDAYSEGWTQPPLFFARHASDRPDGAQVETLPLVFHMRSDFYDAFVPMWNGLRAAGASLPLYAPVAPMLPPLVGGAIPEGDGILALLGRTLDLAPTAAFWDPSQDPLLVAFAESGSEPAVYARNNSAAAVSVHAYGQKAHLPEPAEGEEEDAPVYTQIDARLDAAGWYATPVEAGLIPLAANLGKAGWYPRRPDPAKPFSPDDLLRWKNVTGLVPGVTTLRSELALLYTAGQVAGSVIREIRDAVWNGEEFV
jgi:hypothetical protein